MMNLSATRGAVGAIPKEIRMNTSRPIRPSLTATFFLFFLSSAAHAEGNPFEALQQQIDKLDAQVKTLKRQIAEIAATGPSVTLALVPTDNAYAVFDPENPSESQNPPGAWQHEGGKVLCSDGTQIANYIAYRRMTFSGTGPQNTAAVTLTIFFIGGTPPQNITLQGSHDFNSGGQTGSVSAASKGFEKLRSKAFSMVFAVVGQVFGWELTIENLGSPTINPCSS
jgi:hypothetical protein